MASRLKDDAYQQAYETSKDVVAIQNFDEMGLREPLLEGIYAYGIEKPSAVQQRAIKVITSGRDVIAQSQPGTGKTATFVIASLNIINITLRETQILVLSPTRELAQQTQTVYLAIGDKMNIQCHACIGGLNVGDDIRKLDFGQHVVSGTPGRVYDMMSRGSFRTRSVKMLILDEADQLLSRGFKQQIYEIYRFLPSEAQVVLISATLPGEVLDLTRNFMTDPVRILVKRDDLIPEDIKQFFIHVDQEEFKFCTLCDMFDSMSMAQTIVFCNSKVKVNSLASTLLKQNFTVSMLHGDLPQEERMRVAADFKNGSSRVLIATDLFERGIDVITVSLVINYDLPKNRESFLHRMGRTGRFGRKGVVVYFVKSDEKHVLNEIGTYFSSQIEEMPSIIGDLV